MFRPIEQTVPLSQRLVVFAVQTATRSQSFPNTSSGGPMARTGISATCPKHCGVRRQSFWNQWLRKLRECPAHLVGLIMRRGGCDASLCIERLPCDPFSVLQDSFVASKVDVGEGHAKRRCLWGSASGSTLAIQFFLAYHDRCC